MNYLFKNICLKKIEPIYDKHFGKKLFHMFRIKYYLQIICNLHTIFGNIFQSFIQKWGQKNIFKKPTK